MALGWKQRGASEQWTDRNPAVSSASWACNLLVWGQGSQGNSKRLTDRVGIRISIICWACDIYQRFSRHNKVLGIVQISGLRYYQALLRKEVEVLPQLSYILLIKMRTYLTEGILPNLVFLNCSPIVYYYRSLIFNRLIIFWITFALWCLYLHNFTHVYGTYLFWSSFDPIFMSR